MFAPYLSASSMAACLIENALCSNVICSRIAKGGDPPDGSLAISAYNKILFFSTFSFLNPGKGERNELLASKNKASYWVTK